MHLAADIGGTKGNFALVDRTHADRVIEEFTLASGDYGDFTSMVRSAIERASIRPQTACFAVPGPVTDGAVPVMAAQGWSTDERSLVRDLGLTSVHLLNDLVATAAGILSLPASELATLHPGSPRADGPVVQEVRAVVAPGTGLGEAFCIWDGHAWKVHPAEGGHTGFAPRSVEQADLWDFMFQREGFVTLQSVCSGLGIANIWQWLTARGQGIEPMTVTATINAAPDPTREILARQGESERCRMVLGHLVDILAAECADVAARLLPIGGVYLGGGLPPRLLDRLTDGRFLRTWFSTPQLGHIHQAIPVRVVLNAKAGLIGAIHHRP
jgi:glucokinase